MNLSDLLQIGTMYQEPNTELDYYWLWKDIVLDSRLDKEVLITSILRELSDSTPIVGTVGGFKTQSDAFFKRWKQQISKLIDTMELEYNPIWNVDGDTWETRDIDRERQESVGDDFTRNQTDTDDGTREHQVSADNSSAYQPESYDKTHDGSSTNETTGRDINTNETEGTADRFHQKRTGNIGVTTTQKMINEERELQEFNIYNWIVNKYNVELFLRVW